MNLHTTPNMTGEPIPQTIEADLIKIRTIKRKHVEGLLEPIGTQQITDVADIEFLAYIHERDAILARRKDNGHLVAIRAISYYSRQAQAASSDYQAAQAEAYALVHQLPQLFLD